MQSCRPTAEKHFNQSRSSPRGYPIGGAWKWMSDGKRPLEKLAHPKVGRISVA